MAATEMSRPAHDAQTLGAIAEMVSAGLSDGLYAICMNENCHAAGFAKHLDLVALIDRFGPGHAKSDILATCNACRRAGRDRTQTCTAVSVLARKNSVFSKII
ncbi:MAG: hypothetical protein P1U84_12295 [Parvibaculaceae bacterium]|nr:hypothetical protein [Parvibaculaceae bacterium]